MGAENPGPSPEEQKEFEKSRLIHDAGLVSEGAEYDGETRSVTPTPEQYDTLSAEAKEDLYQRHAETLQELHGLLGIQAGDHAHVHTMSTIDEDSARRNQRIGELCAEIGIIPPSSLEESTELYRRISLEWIDHHSRN